MNPVLSWLLLIILLGSMLTVVLKADAAMWRKKYEREDRIHRDLQDLHKQEAYRAALKRQQSHTKKEQ